MCQLQALQFTRDGNGEAAIDRSVGLIDVHVAGCGLGSDFTAVNDFGERTLGRYRVTSVHKVDSDRFFGSLLRVNQQKGSSANAGRSRIGDSETESDRDCRIDGISTLFQNIRTQLGAKRMVRSNSSLL